MSISRNSVNWWQEDISEKEEIFKKLWVSENLENLGPDLVEAQASFLASCSYGKVTTKDVSEIFQKAKEGVIDFQKFLKFFQWLSPLEAKLIVFNADGKLGSPRSWQSPDAPLADYKIVEVDKLIEYIKDGHISSSVSMVTVDGNPSSIPPAEPYTIHSVAKIFTGVLLLRMFEEKILSEEILDQSINNDLIAPEALKLLPEEVKTHLEANNVTLRQLMTHMGGIGDYGYDPGSGGLRDFFKKQLDVIDVSAFNDIKNFLPFAEKQTYPVDKWKYSNLGLLLVGLAIEYAYQKQSKSNLSFNEIMQKYVINEAKMSCFTAARPENGRYHNSEEDSIEKNWVGSPAGGYWTTTEDLAKFGRWLYEKCKDQNFRSLLKKYGTEYYFEERDVIEHPGNSPASSAFLSVSLKTGNVVAILSDQPGISTALGLELVLGTRVLKPCPQRQNKMHDTASASLLFAKSENKVNENASSVDASKPQPLANSNLYSRKNS